MNHLNTIFTALKNFISNYMVNIHSIKAQFVLCFVAMILVTGMLTACFYDDEESKSKWVNLPFFN